MKVLAGIMLLFLTSTLFAAETEPESVPRFVSLWLKQLQFNDYKLEKEALIIEKSGLEITGAIRNVHEKKEEQASNKVLIEVRFTVKHNGKVLVEEFAGAFGRTKEGAFISALENLCQTIMNPLYKQLVDPKHKHVVVETIKKDKRETTFIYSGLGVMGDTIDEEKSAEIAKLIVNEVAALNIKKGLQTARLVVAKAGEKEAKATLTVGDKVIAEQSEQFKKFEWPEAKKFYLAKFFMVVTQK